MKIFKKLSVVFLLALLVSTACTAGGKKKIEFSKLPQAGQQLVKSYFAGQEIFSITKERDDLATEYEITFKNGTEIDLDSDGEWQSVDCRTVAVPDGLVPAGITSYVNANFQDVSVVKIEREDFGGFEVKLSNGIELEFDRNLNVKFDD